MSDMVGKEEVGQRRLLLRQKLEGNLQRNTRRAYLASLPNGLCRYLSGRHFLPMAEYLHVAPRFRISSGGFGNPSAKPETYRSRKFAWRHKVLEEVQDLDGRHDAQPAFFWPGDDNPIYLVEFGWLRTNLSRLLCYHLGAVLVDGSAGLVVDDYCGYVEGDPNPDEVVYEVVVWGFGAVTNQDVRSNSC